jgi:hypothetical protein
MKLKTIIAAILLSSTSSFALSFDKDVPALIQKQMKEDLAFIATVNGDRQTPFHEKIFNRLEGQKYQDFFNTRIMSVGMDSCGGGAAVACVQPFFEPNKMWLTENFVKFSHPQIARVMVVFHEARHSETNNGSWSHDRCPRPFLDEKGKDMVSIWTGAKLAGEAACDSTPYGSYGSSTIMLRNISKFCTTCGDKVKMDADLYAADQLGRIHRADVKKAMLADFNAKN